MKTAGSVSDTARITMAPRFKRDSAADALAAISAAKIKCYSAGQELVRAYYELSRPGLEPTVASLIAEAGKRYHPPRAQEEQTKFWRDYLLTNLRRGVFALAEK